MQPVALGPWTIGTLLALIGLVLCVLAWFSGNMHTFEVLLGLVALPFVARLT